ncbi:MAG: YihY family inner membrane protein [Hylemonella sp.]|nr:YihY family inner membrane protein [Hylemonella sp.]MDP1935971.1 YihY family inner membrane protein [Hylemonella sp.]
MSEPSRLQVFLQNLSHFPWRNTALTLRERFREDRLGLTASSLTFTTIIALVPLFTVALAVFTAFPMFGKLQEVLQKWLVESLVPDNIARQVLGYLTQFAGKASRLGTVGLAVLFATALSLVFTIDRTLNGIWRVRQSRPLGQRLLIYWTAITLGPLLLASSLAITSYLISASRGLVGGMPGGVRFLLDLLEFFMVAGGMAATYYYVPNTQVKWGHAWAGGIFAAAGIEVAKKLLALYVKAVPTYSAVYGAFATVPILLVWIYVVWVIVLLGAVITAYLPSLLMGVSRRGGTPGWEFTLALDTLSQLLASSQAGRHGLSAEALAEALRVDPVQLQSVLGTLVALDWVGRLEDGDGRYVLLVDPEITSVGPLVDRLLLTPSPRTAFMTINGMKSSSMLREAL